MKRLFTFGCSFTNYRWSTWADCLAPEFDKFYNWGQAGGGNHYIFNSVMEADQRQSFKSNEAVNDTVIVCWTGILRDDRYVDGRWHTLGNMFTCPIYNEEYLKTHVDERGYFIRDLAYIKAVKTLLQNRPGVNWRFLSMDSWQVGPQYLQPGFQNQTQPGVFQDVVNVYSNVLESILPSYYEVLGHEYWNDDQQKRYCLPNGKVDFHPTPQEHLKYLDTVLPGWVTKQETRAKIHEETVNLSNPNCPLRKRWATTKLDRL
jgi:hypothetical protein